MIVTMEVHTNQSEIIPGKVTLLYSTILTDTKEYYASAVSSIAHSNYHSIKVHMTPEKYR